MEKNRVPDYKKISEIIKEDYKIWLSDDELRNRLKWIDILALYKVAYFEYITEEYLNKELDKKEKH